MFIVISSVLIHQPIKRVFDFMTLPGNDALWQYGTLATALIDGAEMAVGTAFRSVGHLLGNRNLGTFEVTHYEPNSAYSYRSLSGPVHSQSSYQLTAEKSGTRVTVTTQIGAVKLARVQLGLLPKLLKKQLKENLALLKDNLEADPPRQ